MITYNIDVFIGRNAPERKTVVKCHDTGVCLSCILMTEERTSKWRTVPKLYTPPVDSTSVIKIKKPDGKYVLQDGERKGSSTLFFELPSQSFTAVGMAEAEINIFGADGRRVTTETFYIDVPQEVADECAEDSETYVSVMARQIQAAIDAAERAEDAAKRTENAGGGTGSGENGATFTPSVSEDGVLSWSNDKKLPNPDPVNIKGPQGDPGEKGEPGDPYTLTDEDKDEMVQAVLAALPDGDEVSY